MGAQVSQLTCVRQGDCTRERLAGLLPREATAPTNKRKPAEKEPETAIASVPRLGATMVRRSSQLLTRYLLASEKMPATGASDETDPDTEKQPRDRKLSMASANLKRAEMATAQVRVAEQDRRKSSRNASNKTSSRNASNKTTAEPPFAVAETLNRTVHQAHAAVDVVVQGLTAASLRAKPALIARVLDLKIRGLAPSLRVAIGGMLQRVRHVGGWRLGGGWRLNVELNDRHNRSLWTDHTPEHGPEEDNALWEAKVLTEPEQEAAHEMVQVLSLRVYPKGQAPTMKEFGETFDDESDDEIEDYDSDEDDSAGGFLDTKHGAHHDFHHKAHHATLHHDALKVLARAHTWKNIPAAELAASAQGPNQHPAIPDYPKEWERERHHVVRIDLDIDVAMQVNWTRFDLFFALERPCCGGTAVAGRLGVLAIAMRVRVCLWWHVSRNEVRMTLTDHENGMHFRSFAEASVGGFEPQADKFGVASRVVRALLKKITPEQPLSIVFPQKPGDKSKLCWGGGVLLEF